MCYQGIAARGNNALNHVLLVSAERLCRTNAVHGEVCAVIFRGNGVVEGLVVQMSKGIAPRFILPYPVLKLGFYGLSLFLGGNGGCLIYIGAPFCIFSGNDNASVVQ